MSDFFQTYIVKNNVNDNIGAYIYFCMQQKEINDNLKLNYFCTFNLCKYFNLPTTRKNGEPTYSNLHGDIFEIGFISENLNETYDKIKFIQDAIKAKGGEIMNEDKEIKVKYEIFSESDDDSYNNEK